MKKKALVVVDCQNDFVDGKLGVGYKKWAKAYPWIEKELNKTDYDRIIITKDLHPYNHCSFVGFGGTWAEHCVQGTDGAKLYWKIQESIDNDINIKKVRHIFKGQDKDKEEYGVDIYLQTPALWDEECEIYFVGIALDYCVAECARMTAEHDNCKCYIIKDACCSIGKKKPNVGKAKII